MIDTKEIEPLTIRRVIGHPGAISRFSPSTHQSLQRELIQETPVINRKEGPVRVGTETTVTLNSRDTSKEVVQVLNNYTDLSRRKVLKVKGLIGLLSSQ